MIAAYWAGYVLAHPALPLIFLACCAVAAVYVLCMRAEDRRDDRGAHAAARGPAVRSRRARPWQRRDRLVPVPEVHHGEYAIPMIVPGRDGKRPATPATAASAGQYHATGHATVDAGPGHPAGDQAPGPVGPPDGDTPAVPPQAATGPGDLSPGRVVPEHPCDCPACRINPDGPAMLPADAPDGDHPDGLPPMSPLLASALRELEDAQRWPHLAPGAGYSNGRPFHDWERDSVVMPAIRGL